MKNIFLNEYVRSGLFLKDLETKNPFDVIITFKAFSYEHKLECPVIVLEQEKDIAWALAYYTSNFVTPLLIVDGFDLANLFPLLFHIPYITVVNVQTWYGSMGHVSSVCLQDVWLALQSWCEVYEPFDVNSLVKYLLLSLHDAKSYIRLSWEELPQHFPEIGYEDMIMLKQVSLDTRATLVFTGSSLTTAVGVGNALEIASTPCNVFLSPVLTAEFSQAFIDSLHHTKRCIFFVDQQAGSFYEQYIKAKIFDLWLDGIKIYFLTPLYDQLTTVMPEYQSQQVQFDVEWILHRIGNVLETLS